MNEGCNLFVKTKNSAATLRQLRDGNRGVLWVGGRSGPHPAMFLSLKEFGSLILDVFPKQFWDDFYYGSEQAFNDRYERRANLDS